MGHNKMCEQIFYILSDHAKPFPCNDKLKRFHAFVLIIFKHF